MDRIWSDMYNDEVLEYSRPETISNEEIFSDAYNFIVHSSLSSALMQLELEGATDVYNKFNEMQIAMSATQLSEFKTLQDSDIVGQRYESTLSHVHDTKVRELRSWIMNVSESKMGVSSTRSIPVQRSDSTFSISTSCTAPVRQESFTITLGAQMKLSHNLRLIAADAIDLCTYPTQISGKKVDDIIPLRQHTAMSLYSSNLCGIVLLAVPKSQEHEDDCVYDYTEKYLGVRKMFVDLCRRSPEVHFGTFESQLNEVRSNIDQAVTWRKKHLQRQESFRNSYGCHEKHDKVVCDLRCGDFFISRHSNLCEMHIVFHLLCDASVRAVPASSVSSISSACINSRHPAIMALRNVLKTASLYDVTTLTIPLLLVEEMNEAMTVAWCLRRAELVLKCVKGFMMELTSWGGSEIKTLQFLLPKDIDVDVFQKISDMVNNIFRTTNPIRSK